MLRSDDSHVVAQGQRIDASGIGPWIGVSRELTSRSLGSICALGGCGLLSELSRGPPDGKRS
jgi:hypothetical protein